VARNRILLGVIGRPHGVRGLVHVTSHTADPADLTAYGALSDDSGRRFELRWRGEDLAEVTMHMDGTAVKIADRTAAARLTNTRLYVDRTQLPEPETEEFYLADLIGTTAIDDTGRVLGEVVTVHDYGAGPSLEIVQDGAPPILVPFTRACVPEVDIAAGRLLVRPADEVPDIVQDIEAQSGEGHAQTARPLRAPHASLRPATRGTGARADASPAAGARGTRR
jgi:16S rRNA processing protein RimM